MIKVLVNGAHGKMGAEVVLAVSREEDMVVVGKIDRFDNLAERIQTLKPDVVVDFTHPDVVSDNVKTILSEGVRPVVGTTGLSDADLKAIQTLVKKKKLGAIVAPNFAIGAILMMKFAAEASKYMPRVEIVEYHHDNKADAPSGTAIKTAEMIAATNHHINQSKRVETEIIPHVRGGKKAHIPIHSIRLPGYVAHQEVLFGGLGQTLSIRHDALSRESFMPGVILSIRKVMQMDHFVYGLENLI
jgi:4-hydroxy-tetrahydrodipicolinate reductase